MRIDLENKVVEVLFMPEETGGGDGPSLGALTDDHTIFHPPKILILSSPEEMFHQRDLPSRSGHTPAETRQGSKRRAGWKVSGTGKERYASGLLIDEGDAHKITGGGDGPVTTGSLAVTMPLTV